MMMLTVRRTLMTFAAVAVGVATTCALASSAEARHHRRSQAAKAAPILVAAHERPGFVHATGIGLIDLGYGPVFPFGGWPK